MLFKLWLVFAMKTMKETPPFQGNCSTDIMRVMEEELGQVNKGTTLS
jgi:hypothetical protein